MSSSYNKNQDAIPRNKRLFDSRYIYDSFRSKYSNIFVDNYKWSYDTMCNLIIYEIIVTESNYHAFFIIRILVAHCETNHQLKDRFYVHFYSFKSIF